MAERKPPGKELLWAVWAAVLTPAVRLLPGACARLGGAAGWLAPLAALPALLIAAALPGRIVRREEDGLAPAVERLLGRRSAAGLYTIYIIWAVVLAAARLRLSGQFFLSAVGQDGLLLPVAIPTAALAAWLAAKRRAAVVRAGSMTGRLLAAALVGWIVLALFRLRVRRLWPLNAGELWGTLRAGALTLGYACAGIYAAFFGWTPCLRRGRRVASMAAALALVQACVLGGLGPALCAETEDPFILLSRGVGVEGAVRRVESLAAAVGLLGDVLLAALLLGACRHLLGRLRPAWGAEKTAIPLAGAVCVLSLTVFRQAALARAFGLTAAPAGNLLLGLAVPGGLCLLERRQKTRGISCASPQAKKADIVRKNRAKKSLEKEQKNC